MDIVDYVKSLGFPEKLVPVIDTFNFSDEEIKELNIEDLGSNTYQIGNTSYFILDESDWANILEEYEDETEDQIDSVLDDSEVGYIKLYIDWVQFWKYNAPDIYDFYPELTELEYKGMHVYYSDLDD